MTNVQFWLAAVALVGVALAFVLPPLLRRGDRQRHLDSATANRAIHQAQIGELEADLRNGTLDPGQYDAALHDIEERRGHEVPATEAAAGGGRWAGFALSAAIPLAAVVAYLLFGSPDHLVALPASVTAAAEQHDPAAMVAALEAKLKAQPDDGAGWAMLGRSYVELGRNQEGAQALQRAAQLLPGDASVLADYAEAVALTQERNMAGIPSEYVARALALNDKNDKALLLAGVAASQRHEFTQAAAYWRRLQEIAPKETELGRQVAVAIEQADAAAAEMGARRAGMGPSRPQAAPSLSGTLTVSKRIAAKVSPGDTVFIFAQLPNGPPRPLAVQRITAGQLPYHFTLDDSMSMPSGDKLSSHSEFMLTARVSKSGQALPQGGDLQGRVGPVKLGQQDISLSIDGEIAN